MNSSSNDAATGRASGVLGDKERVGKMMMTVVLLLYRTDVMRKDFLTSVDDK